MTLYLTLYFKKYTIFLYYVLDMFTKIILKYKIEKKTYCSSIFSS